jgi:hypothetical protein
MKGPGQEALDAKDNLDLDAKLAALAPPPADAKTTNGTGDKKKVPAISGRNSGGKNE